jgi:hypothetical protein
MPPRDDRAVDAAGRHRDAPDMPAPRHSRLVTALAILLALESVTVVAARAAEIRDAQLSASPVAVSDPSAVARSTAATHASFAIARATAGLVGDVAALRAAVVVRPVAIDPGPTSREVESAPAPKPPPAVAAATAVKVTTSPRSSGSTGGAAGAAASSFRGRNHVWSPALGIDKPVYSFPCTRSEYPGNVVYRWGCAGRNNVYLFGHAANVFAGLNRAYYAGTLKPGIKVHYADASGKVRTYSVRWWKVVYPTPDEDWAWASLARPSMTLQTCVGKNSEKRLMVRLVQVSG